ncbi:hypothetical protein GIB67_027406 [Kingdonia uniflora]|uniref:Nematode resistance protein-like HSPRO2 n=1 Tax=Kingdonia uniflora TaxID=39325 RepID=A0A7J7MF33_9MAGN|nr:hypothetical protein GIB67_027406 [Kingdonia uniflora]
MIVSEISAKSPKLSKKPPNVSLPSSILVAGQSSSSSSPSSASATACLAYEHYLHLLELTKLWSTKQFPNWNNELIIKPALQALEITFRFISIVLSDSRPYSNHREWTRRLDSLTTHQLELIATLCEDEEEDGKTRGTAPIVDLNTLNGMLARDGNGKGNSAVWKVPGATQVVSRTSEESLLPRLATWRKSEDIASKMMFSIECQMKLCPYTLGLGETNLSNKPIFNYDLVCRPLDLHLVKKTANLENSENQMLFTTHQILESWIYVSRGLLKRIAERIDGQDFDRAASDCWLLERIWKLLSEIEDLHLLMDPDDFLRLKNQLAIKSSSESESFCFRSKGLLEITKLSRDLKHRVPEILGVEVDPKGGPRLQEEAMRLYHGHEKGSIGKVHLLQAFQAVESSLKGFFFSYRQLLVIVMGSLEANGNRAFNMSDSLSRIFSEPTCFPSLDAAKTFLGDYWRYENVTSKGPGTDNGCGMMEQ